MSRDHSLKWASKVRQTSELHESQSYLTGLNHYLCQSTVASREIVLEEFAKGKYKMNAASK